MGFTELFLCLDKLRVVEAFTLMNATGLEKMNGLTDPAFTS
uniref:Uncharacterized protein n=1 Tax=Anguilla anguilla TaxID=7936 RepID=A0A0E9XAJ9_ANGAN